MTSLLTFYLERPRGYPASQGTPRGTCIWSARFTAIAALLFNQPFDQLKFLLHVAFLVDSVTSGPRYVQGQQSEEEKVLFAVAWLSYSETARHAFRSTAREQRMLYPFSYPFWYFSRCGWAPPSCGPCCSVRWVVHPRVSNLGSSCAFLVYRCRTLCGGRWSRQHLLYSFH
jgi:hypothetical protein